MPHFFLDAAPVLYRIIPVSVTRIGCCCCCMPGEALCLRDAALVPD